MRSRAVTRPGAGARSVVVRLAGDARLLLFLLFVVGLPCEFLVSSSSSSC
jgi:hypothetical protein